MDQRRKKKMVGNGDEIEAAERKNQQQKMCPQIVSIRLIPNSKGELTVLNEF
jgi:hypothetical protein